MLKSLLAVVAASGILFSFSLALRAAVDKDKDPDAKADKITGVLIDQHCGAGTLKKDDPEKVDWQKFYEAVKEFLE